jgi:hypothetical protein
MKEMIQKVWDQAGDHGDSVYAGAEGFFSDWNDDLRFFLLLFSMAFSAWFFGCFLQVA